MAFSLSFFINEEQLNGELVPIFHNTVIEKRRENDGGLEKGASVG